MPSEVSAIILLIMLCATFLTAGMVGKLFSFSRMSPIVVWEGKRISCSENSLHWDWRCCWSSSAWTVAYTPPLDCPVSMVILLWGVDVVWEGAADVATYDIHHGQQSKQVRLPHPSSMGWLKVSITYLCVYECGCFPA